MSSKSKAAASRTKKHNGATAHTDKDSLERRTEIAVFSLVAYDMLRGQKKQGGKFDRVHVIYSGFNDAFKKFFPDEDPIACTKQLEAEGLITIKGARRGVSIQPTLNLLREPTTEERRIAAHARQFLADFIVSWEAKMQEYRARQAQLSIANAKAPSGRSTAEKTAHELAKAGDIDGALKKLKW